VRAAESQAIPLTRIEDAFGRQERIKARYLNNGRGRAPLGVIGSTAHQVVASEMAAWL
jgi:hypothetical protein